MKSLSQAIISLFQEQMFYAELILQMRRITDYTLPSVAGVCIKNGIELHVNPTFNTPDGKTFDTMDISERVAVLKHECEHILREHIGRAKVLAPAMFEKQESMADQIINSMKFRTLNVAMDCAINPAIPNVPKWGCFPKMFNLQDGETFEWYHAQFQQDEKAKKKMEEMMGIDPHALWAASAGTKEMIEATIRNAANKAAQSTRAAGRMTANDEMLIDKLNKTESVNWKQQLRRFIAHAVETKIESSRKKRNRRYGIHIPGSKKLEELHLGVAKDSSGSVSDESYAQFMAEIENIAKYARVTMIDADTEVKNIEEFKKGATVKRKGYGGTAYQPAFDFFNKDKTVDAVIYFGDMDTYDREVMVKPKYSVLWAIVGDQKPPVEWGGQIKIKVNQEE